jgi:hypothetical protein
LRFVKTAVEFADVRFAVIGPLAFAVVVVNEQAKPGTLAAGRLFQHPEIAVGV